jgi:hypothetical protein
VYYWQHQAVPEQAHVSFAVDVAKDRTGRRCGPLIQPGKRGINSVSRGGRVTRLKKLFVMPLRPKRYSHLRSAPLINSGPTYQIRVRPVPRADAKPLACLPISFPFRLQPDGDKNSGTDRLTERNPAKQKLSMPQPISPSPRSAAHRGPPRRFAAKAAFPAPASCVRSPIR